MKKVLLLVFLVSNLIFAQNTCESNEDLLEDLNSITKCSIEPSKKSGSTKTTRQISVKISAPKTRFLKKRVEQKKMVASSAGNLSSSGISEINHNSNISNSLDLKENTAIKSVALLTSTLSEEEVKSAVGFHEISEIPTFESCKSEKGNNRLDCFNKEMIQHVEKHFSYPNEALINKTQGKVWVRFIIDKEGNIGNVKTLGPKGGEILNKEAKRVVSQLPKFVPGKKDGNKVSVKYGFPISFSLDQE